MQGIFALLFLIVFGGIVAYTGDYVGRFIGRRRVTLFGLRPKFTAIIITTISGLIIALTTILFLLVFSKDVRIALFGLEKLQNEITEKTKTLEKLKLMHSRQLASLEAELSTMESAVQISKRELFEAELKAVILSKQEKRLKSKIDISKSASVIFRINDCIYISTIEGGRPERDLREDIKKILNDAGRAYLPNAELNNSISYLSLKPGQIIVRVVAAKNILAGEQISAHLDLEINKLIYKKGQKILSSYVNGSFKKDIIEQEIKNIIKKTDAAAKRKGVIPDKSGVSVACDYSEIDNAVSRLMFWKKSLEVEMTAKDDTYAIGPLKINIRVVEWSS